MSVELLKDVRAYVETLNAQILKKRAAELLYKMGNSGMFQNEEGGVVGHLIRQDLPGASSEMVAAVMRALGIKEDWVPTSAILRDALPMVVHLRRLLLPLTGGYIDRRKKLVDEIWGMAAAYNSPDEVTLSKLEWLERLAEDLEKAARD